MGTIKKRFLAGVTLILLIGVTTFLLIYIFGLIREVSSPNLPQGTPIAQGTPSPKRIPSSLANEPGFLKLEEDLKLLEQDLTTVDLSEAKLSLPILEMKVNFEK